MLDSNNHNHLNCAFAEQKVSYLYGEIDAREKAAFETHLNSCAICQEELANFGAIRASVIEWRNEEFLPLATPALEIPYAKSPKSVVKSQTDSSVSRSWLEEIRRLFSLSPAFGVSASLAAIILCLGVVFFVNKNSKTVEVADADSKKTERTISSEKIETKNVADSDSTGNSENEVAEISTAELSNHSIDKDKIKTRNTIPKSRPTRNGSLVNFSDAARNSAIIQNRESKSPVNKAVKAETKQLLFAQTNKLPGLNNVEEDEDKSLRLAELLEDGGAK